MRSQDKTVYDVYELKPGVTCIDDYSDATSYLIEGESGALLIDTGWGADNFADIVKSLTDKPVALALTHLHKDHIRHAGRFDTIYMHEDDLRLLKAGPEKEPWLDRAVPVSGGQRITHGGLNVEVLAVPGHTPGSAAYLDEARGFVFTGDAIGSGEGVWMQVDAALPLREYQRGLRAFLRRLSACGVLSFCGGHIGQCGRPYTAKFNLLTIATVRDMIALIDEVIAGRADRHPFSLPGRSWPEQPYIARLGTASMVYRESGAREEA